MNGWPSDKPLYDHVSYEILKFHAEHKDEYTTKRLTNPGPSVTPREGNMMSSRITLGGVPSKYPEMDEFARVGNRDFGGSNVNRLKLRSKRTDVIGGA